MSALKKSKDGFVVLALGMIVMCLFFSTLIFIAENTGEHFNETELVWYRDDGSKRYSSSFLLFSFFSFFYILLLFFFFSLFLFFFSFFSLLTYPFLASLSLLLLCFVGSNILLLVISRAYLMGCGIALLLLQQVRYLSHLSLILIINKQ